MPIVRYFLFAGAFITALLFALDRALPPLAEPAASPDVDRGIIRIRSAQAWPERIVFDTSTQIATAVSSPVLAAEQPGDKAGHARATKLPQQPETTIAHLAGPGAVRTNDVHAKRPAHPAAARRLSDRRMLVDAF